MIGRFYQSTLLEGLILDISLNMHAHFKVSGSRQPKIKAKNNNSNYTNNFSEDAKNTSSMGTQLARVL